MWSRGLRNFFDRIVSQDASALGKLMEVRNFGDSIKRLAEILNTHAQNSYMNVRYDLCEVSLRKSCPQKSCFQIS